MQGVLWGHTAQGSHFAWESGHCPLPASPLVGCVRVATGALVCFFSCFPSMPSGTSCEIFGHTNEGEECWSRAFQGWWNQPQFLPSKSSNWDMGGIRGSPSTSRTRAANRPSQEGAGRKGDWNGVTGNKARQRVTPRNESQGQSCLLSSARSS